MDAISRILAPTDLSTHSERGVRYALELAAAVRAEVIVFHVAPFEEEFPYPLGIGDVSSAYVPAPGFEEYLRSRREALDRFAKQHFATLMSGLRVSLEVDMGDAAQAIVDKAEAVGADLIVMATHGRTGIDHILIGSITEQVLRHARCPVLSLRSTVPNTEQD
jgi:nucleotide-binding universal stress UspA family protein